MVRQQTNKRGKHDILRNDISRKAKFTSESLHHNHVRKAILEQGNEWERATNTATNEEKENMICEGKIQENMIIVYCGRTAEFFHCGWIYLISSPQSMHLVRQAT